MKKELRELIVMLTDAYKLFHRQMYPNNTITVYSNGTPRASKHYKGDNKDEVIVFGTQRLVKKLRDSFDEFFSLSEKEITQFCSEQLSSFTGTKYDIEHITYLHRLQKLPLIIKSLPEGTKCPIRVPYMTFYNTDPECFWLTNYLETYISCEIWPLITNATIANEYREIFEKWAMETVGNTDFVPFQGHDFSMRGMFGSEAARMSGLAHLTSFCGSDTIPSYLDAQYYYNSGQNDWENFNIVATSVPATEHSVQCAHYNPKDGDELAYLDHILATFPTGIVSIVCDGFDFWKFITEVLPQRKDVIMARNGKVVVRPDSGNIVDIITGKDAIEIPAELLERYRDNMQEEYAEDIKRNGYIETLRGANIYRISKSSIRLSHQHEGAIEVLYGIFGGTTNDKGYIELDEHIGLIYGDSVTLQIADLVCSRLADKGLASTNWVAGIGSYTYTFNTRDSHGQAIKATYVEFLENSGQFAGATDFIKGKEIFKDPATGDGMKKSAKGLISVEYSEADKEGNRKLELIDQVSWDQEKSSNNKLQIIFEDSQLKNQTTLNKVRNKIKE